MTYLSEPETHEDRIEDKVNPYNAKRGHQIFACSICKRTRVYGYGTSVIKRALLLCEGICRNHTWHNFLRSI